MANKSFLSGYTDALRIVQLYFSASSLYLYVKISYDKKLDAKIGEADDIEKLLSEFLPEDTGSGTDSGWKPCANSLATSLHARCRAVPEAARRRCRIVEANWQSAPDVHV